jgi:alkanesulfonate monooxygenase SsuD/methylene tetrahydromethanopterin reductase-like flavin-dependent oxidoreductase (luciferase family)
MTVAIGLGLTEFPFAGAGDYWRWVDLCEAGGIDSLWQTDRLVSRQPILECMAVMAALAGRTRRLRFGMNVVSLALRDPVLLAKQCATIDVLSEGRLLPGFGIGSPLGPEWEALDIDTKTRGRRTDEALQIIARLWREDSVDFEGKHWRLKAASISPKPVQPDLPMWIGGSSEAAIRRTARYGTGGGRSGPHHRRGSLRGCLPVLLRQPGRRRSVGGHGCLPEADGPRSVGLLRDR